METKQNPTGSGEPQAIEQILENYFATSSEPLAAAFRTQHAETYETNGDEGDECTLPCKEDEGDGSNLLCKDAEGDGSNPPCKDAEGDGCALPCKSDEAKGQNPLCNNNEVVESDGCTLPRKDAESDGSIQLCNSDEANGQNPLCKEAEGNGSNPLCNSDEVVEIYESNLLCNSDEAQGQNPLCNSDEEAEGDERNTLFKDVFPNTELDVNLKLLTRSCRRMNIGEVLPGAIIRDGEGHFTFIERAFERKEKSLIKRNPHVLQLHYINVKRKDDGTLYPTFNRPAFTQHFTFQDFCRKAARELLMVAGSVKEEELNK